LSILDVGAHEDILNLLSHVILTEHLVTFVKDENLKVIELHHLVPAKLHDSAWCSNDDVWRLWPFQYLNILLNGNSSKENFGSDVGEMFSESFNFFLDLVSQLSDITQNQNSSWLWLFFQLLQD